MEKEDIEKFYGDENKRLESEFQNSKDPRKEVKYREKSKKMREKYLKLSKEYIINENKRVIKEIKRKKKKKKIDSSKEEVQNSGKVKYKNDLWKFKRRIILRNIYHKLSLYRILFAVKKIKIIFKSNISYIFLVIASYTHRKYIKGMAKTKKIIARVTDIWHKSLAYIKKIIPKKKPKNNNKEAQESK